jgi:hypothetical protein
VKYITGLFFYCFVSRKVPLFLTLCMLTKHRCCEGMHATE